jgi:beta-lactamase superfamily II metal-dependent hydrolase
MSLVKSFAVGNGDMYYIRHETDNFTIIDCSLPEERGGSIMAELKAQSRDKGISRFISTHPDQDHISGLMELDDLMPIRNFYCVKNSATKSVPTDDFKRYCSLRDDQKKAFYLARFCKRRWMNQSDEGRSHAGLQCLWPIVGDPDHTSALADAAAGMTPNNISSIVQYKREDGVTMVWMGDLETDYMEKLQKKFDLPEVDILFAPHHGRDSGKVPPKWLQQLNPGLIIIGEAPSEYLNYYDGYDIITQNSTGDVVFDCVKDKVHIYVAEHTYRAPCLDDENQNDAHSLYYLGTLQCA